MKIDKLIHRKAKYVKLVKSEFKHFVPLGLVWAGARGSMSCRHTF